MELRVLGAHNMESKHTRMESHLIDGVLALDAGSITRALSFDEQLAKLLDTLRQALSNSIDDVFKISLVVILVAGLATLFLRVVPLQPVQTVEKESPPEGRGTPALPGENAAGDS